MKLSWICMWFGACISLKYDGNIYLQSFLWTLVFSIIQYLLDCCLLLFWLLFASSKSTAFLYSISPVQKSVQNHFCSKNIYIWKANYGFPENIRKILREIFKEFISDEAAGFGPACHLKLSINYSKLSWNYPDCSFNLSLRYITSKHGTILVSRNMISGYMMIPLLDV